MKLGGATQDDLIITPFNEPIIRVDDLEVAQFIYLLLNHKKLRNVLNAVTTKGVLIVPSIEKGRKSHAMFVDLFKYPWVLRPPIEFATVEELLARMSSEMIAPTEERHQARQKLLDELFKRT